MSIGEFLRFSLRYAPLWNKKTIEFAFFASLNSNSSKKDWGR